MLPTSLVQPLTSDVIMIQKNASNLCIKGCLLCVIQRVTPANGGTDLPLLHHP